MSIQQFCLRWNNHQPNFISVFTTLLNTESLVDVTLAAEGKHLQAHKVVLSACSVYFQTLFTANPSRHPIVILKDVKYADLRIMVDFMYYGEVNVSQEQLPQILETAKMLKIKGLTEMPDSTSLTKSQSTSSADLLTPGESSWESQRHSISPCNLSPSVKRKRFRKTSTGSGSACLERSAEDKGYDANTGASLNLVKSDSITLSSLPQRRKESYQDYHKEVDENGAMDATLQQGTDETNNMSVDALSMENSAPSLHHQDPGPASKSKARRGKPLLRQGRVKKESESSDEVASAGPTLARSASEPAPHTAPLTIRKQTSHPPLKFVKVRRQLKASGSPTPLLLGTPPIDVVELPRGLPLSAALPDIPEPSSEIFQSQRASHCPALRAGPPLACNFCWNTVDERGRILRRKTKYHCPECNANLCIVPCFHEYHAAAHSDHHPPK